MKLIRTTGMVAMALSLVVFSAGEVAAQAPALSVSANGASVTINWTDVPGALGYNVQVGSTPGASNIGQLNLPANISRPIVVSAPNGTYFMRVRGLAGAVVGPFSNEASVTVGGSIPGPPGPCVAPAAPSITTNVSGGSVQVSWSNVPGAIGYRIELSRSPNTTEAAQNVAGTSHQQYIGMLGTFYVRVVAGNACGTATSDTKSFTIENLNSGSGPRTPDPPPGQILPLPGYGAQVVRDMANAFAGDLFNSCVEHGGNNVFMFRVVQALRQRDSRWGLNWKRGNRGDLSQDIVTYNFGPGPDEDTTNVYIIDMIGGHCGNSPTWNWADVTEATRQGNAIGRWTLQPYLRAGLPPDSRQ